MIICSAVVVVSGFFPVAKYLASTNAILPLDHAALH